MKKETKKITVRMVFAWIFSILFIVGGVGMLFNSPLSGVLTFIAGVIILPPFNKMLKEKANIEISTWLKIIIVLVLLVIAGTVLPSEDEDDTSVINDCNPNWQCSSWSACSSSGKQTRTCLDNNNCGVLTNKPSESQSCTLPVEESDKTTMGEKNALDTALSYLRYMSFSYSGLIEQLEFEGYTYEEAVYGVNNCGADWNEQATLVAQSYLDYMAFSREGLIEQLEFEGFTKEQAEYGVQAVGY